MDAGTIAAIQTLVGRAPTTEEQALGDAREDTALAASLSTGLTQIVSPAGITELLCIKTLGPVAAGAFLDAIDVFVAAGVGACPAAFQPYFSATKRTMAQLYISQGLDMGDPNTAAVLDALVGLNIGVTQASVNTLLATAVKPRVIPVDSVSAILNGGL